MKRLLTLTLALPLLTGCAVTDLVTSVQTLTEVVGTITQFGDWLQTSGLLGLAGL